MHLTVLDLIFTSVFAKKNATHALVCQSCKLLSTLIISLKSIIVAIASHTQPCLARQDLGSESRQAATEVSLCLSYQSQISETNKKQK